MTYNSIDYSTKNNIDEFLSATNPYLETLLHPWTTLAVIPDDNMTTSIPKQIAITSNIRAPITGSGLLLFVPNSNGDVLIHYVYKGGRYIFVSVIGTDEDLATNFDLVRFVSGGLKVYSSTVSSGVFTLSGVITATGYQSLPDLRTLSYAGIQSHSRNYGDSIVNLEISNGIVALAHPDGSNQYYSKQTGSVRKTGDHYISRLSSWATNTTNRVLDVLPTLPPNWWGAFGLHGGLVITGVVPTTLNVTLSYETYDIATDTIVIVTNIRTLPSVISGGFQQFTLDYDYDIPCMPAAFQVSLTSTTLPVFFGNNDTLTVEGFSYFDRGRINPGTMIGYEGVTGDQILTFNGVLNYQAVPNQILNQQITTSYSPQLSNPFNLVLAELAIQRRVVNFVYERSAYELAVRSGRFDQALSNSELMEGADFWSIIKRLMQIGVPIVSEVAGVFNPQLGAAIRRGGEESITRFGDDFELRNGRNPPKRSRVKKRTITNVFHGALEDQDYFEEIRLDHTINSAHFDVDKHDLIADIVGAEFDTPFHRWNSANTNSQELDFSTGYVFSELGINSAMGIVTYKGKRGSGVAPCLFSVTMTPLLPEYMKVEYERSNGEYCSFFLNKGEYTDTAMAAIVHAHSQALGPDDCFMHCQVTLKNKKLDGMSVSLPAYIAFTNKRTRSIYTGGVFEGQLITAAEVDIKLRGLQIYFLTKEIKLPLVSGFDFDMLEGQSVDLFTDYLFVPQNASSMGQNLMPDGTIPDIIFCSSTTSAMLAGSQATRWSKKRMTKPSDTGDKVDVNVEGYPYTVNGKTAIITKQELKNLDWKGMIRETVHNGYPSALPKSTVYSAIKNGNWGKLATFYGTYKITQASGDKYFSKILDKRVEPEQIQQLVTPEVLNAYVKQSGLSADTQKKYKLAWDQGRWSYLLAVYVWALQRKSAGRKKTTVKAPVAAVTKRSDQKYSFSQMAQPKYVKVAKKSLSKAQPIEVIRSEVPEPRGDEVFDEIDEIFATMAAQEAQDDLKFDTSTSVDESSSSSDVAPIEFYNSETSSEDFPIVSQPPPQPEPVQKKSKKAKKGKSATTKSSPREAAIGVVPPQDDMMSKMFALLTQTSGLVSGISAEMTDLKGRFDGLETEVSGIKSRQPKIPFKGFSGSLPTSKQPTREKVVAQTLAAPPKQKQKK